MRPRAIASVPTACGFALLLQMGCMIGAQARRDPSRAGVGKETITTVKEVSEPSTAVTNVSPITPNSILLAGRIDIARQIQNGEKIFILFSGKQDNDRYFHIWKKGLPSPVESGMVKITADEVDDWDPLMSRDGRQVYFTSNRWGNRFSLWRTNTTGIGGVTKIVGSEVGDDRRVDISPDGRRLLFTSESMRQKGMKVETENMMWVVNLDGTELTQLRLGNNARWSPNGKKIVFDYEGEIWLMEADGSETTKLTSRGGIQPYWSPDGQEICFTSYQGEGKKANWDIWKMRHDGSELMQLTLSPGTDIGPVWSPTDEIFYLSNRGREAANFGIWKMAIKNVMEDVSRSAAKP